MQIRDLITQQMLGAGVFRVLESTTQPEDSASAMLETVLSRAKTAGADYVVTGQVVCGEDAAASLRLIRVSDGTVVATASATASSDRPSETRPKSDGPADPVAKGEFGAWTGAEAGRQERPVLSMIWREPLHRAVLARATALEWLDRDRGPEFVPNSFAVGDVYGNGEQRLVLLRYRSESTEDEFKYSDPRLNASTRILGALVVIKWDGKVFRRIWEEDERTGYQGDGTVRIPKAPEGPHPIVVSTAGKSLWYGWSGTTFAQIGIGSSFTLTEWFGQSPAQVSGICNNVPFLAHLGSVANQDDLDTLSEDAAKTASIQAPRSTLVLAGDVDGDKETELILLDRTKGSNALSVWSQSGTLKSRSDPVYGLNACIWHPRWSKLPFIVAQRNRISPAGRMLAARLVMLQWNGEVYEEVWTSRELGQTVTDIQVGDPKDEGASGIVVLFGERRKELLGEGTAWFLGQIGSASPP